MKEEKLGEKFGQLQEKSRLLLVYGQNMTVFGENSMRNIEELQQQPSDRKVDIKARKR